MEAKVFQVRFTYTRADDEVPDRPGVNSRDMRVSRGRLAVIVGAPLLYTAFFLWKDGTRLREVYWDGDIGLILAGGTIVFWWCALPWLLFRLGAVRPIPPEERPDLVRVKIAVQCANLRWEGDTTVVVSKDGLTWRARQFTNHESWAGMAEISEDHAFVALVTRTGCRYRVPKRAFTSPESLAAFVAAPGPGMLPLVPATPTISVNSWRNATSPAPAAATTCGGPPPRPARSAGSPSGLMRFSRLRRNGS